MYVRTSDIYSTTRRLLRTPANEKTFWLIFTFAKTRWYIAQYIYIYIMYRFIRRVSSSVQIRRGANNRTAENRINHARSSEYFNRRTNETRSCSYYRYCYCYCYVIAVPVVLRHTQRAERNAIKTRTWNVSTVSKNGESELLRYDAACVRRCTRVDGIIIRHEIFVDVRDDENRFPFRGSRGNAKTNARIV